MATTKVKTPLSKEEKKAIKARLADIGKVTGEPSTQNAIPFRTMSRDGIAMIPHEHYGKFSTRDFYSITIEFGDITYQLADDDTQQTIFEQYRDVLNYFDDTVDFQLTFEVRRQNKQKILLSISLPLRTDAFDDIREEYSSMIGGKLSEGNNGTELVKYLTFGLRANNEKEAREKLNALSEEIIKMFKKMNVKAVRLDGKSRLEVLFRSLNPYTKDKFLFDWDFMQKIGASPKDYIAPPSLCFGVNDFEHSDGVGTILYISLLAADISDRVLYDFLSDNDLLCVNIHAKPYDQQKARRVVSGKLTGVKAKKADMERKNAAMGILSDMTPEPLLNAIDELTSLNREVAAKEEQLFNITMTIRVYAKNEKKLLLKIDNLRRVCQNANCRLFRLDYQQEQGFCGSLPLGVNTVVNDRAIQTSGLAVIMPFTSRELFQFEDPLASYYGLNMLTHNMIFANKLTLKNPNGLILGTPGSGKSFSAKREIFDVFLRTNDDIFITDPEGEYFPSVAELGGQVVTLSSASSDYINPMDIALDALTYTENNAIAEKSDFLMSLLELVVGGQYGLTSVERSLIDQATRMVYRNFLENSPRIENMPMLQDLHNELMKYGDPAERVATSMDMYVHGSQNLFNHRTNVNIQNRIVCFDIKNLGQSLKKIGMLVVQESVWGRVSINRNAHRTTRFYIDEFHLLLKEAQTAKYSAEIWKRFRKWGGVPTGITQNVKDLLSSAEVENIFENSEFIYLLNQAPGDRHILAEKLGISLPMMEYVTNAEQGSGLIKYGETVIPFTDRFPQDTKLYRLMTTKPADIG